MAVEFHGYWGDETPLSEHMKSPKEFAKTLEKVIAEPLPKEMPDELARKFQRTFAEINGYVVVEESEPEDPPAAKKWTSEVRVWKL